MDAEKAIGELTDLLGGELREEVSIQDIDGTSISVPLKLPAAREVKAARPLLAILNKVRGDSRFKLDLPPRNPGESQAEHEQRIGMLNAGKILELLLSMVTEEVIEAGAAILGKKTEEVGERYQLDQLVKLILPFSVGLFKRLQNNATGALVLRK